MQHWSLRFVVKLNDHVQTKLCYKNLSFLGPKKKVHRTLIILLTGLKFLFGLVGINFTTSNQIIKLAKVIKLCSGLHIQQIGLVTTSSVK